MSDGRQSVIDLLGKRERYGVRNNDTISFSGFKLSKRIKTRELSAVAVWNPKRLNNMILAVGPGTPASVLLDQKMISASSSRSSESESETHSSAQASASRQVETARPQSSGASVEATANDDVSMDAGIAHTNDSNRDEDDDSLGGGGQSSNNSSNENSDDEEEEGSGQEENDSLPHYYEEESLFSADDSSNSTIDNLRHSAHYQASIKHGGCINTATWMNCPWRISLAKTDDSGGDILNKFIISSSYSSNSAVPDDEELCEKYTAPASALDAYECPTQMLTSGDDKLVKIWNCSGSMGSINPLPGPTTICPFAYSEAKPSSSYIINEWKEKTRGTNRAHGIVELLVTVRTGHRGNVFHATPLSGRPGKILTCAADGQLNLSDIEVQSTSAQSLTSSTTIIGSEGRDRGQNGMCFSHHMLNDNSGLLCCEGGLRRFDLRQPPQSQPSTWLLRNNDACTSCAIFSSSGYDSTYAFVGGREDLGLYDLRFYQNSSKVIQTYRPACFPPSIKVSVSGIDISKDRKELLVSYENDQAYTFPIFPSCSTDPSLEEIDSFSESPQCNPHFASYGGHLNRFTFLKSAKYAGPCDEYICTGSDSGHAVIYDKKTTAIVSLLKADTSTCNGIVPHPVLPIFITYGISSTAKLWRATMPVDDETDDSMTGRRKAWHHTKHYEKSNIVSRWANTKSFMSKMRSSSEIEDFGVRLFPDEFAENSKNIDDNNFEGLRESFFRRLFHGNPSNPGSEEICNDLASTPSVLQSNYYEAVTAIRDSNEAPVRCSLDELHRRMSLIRLHYQADRLGLSLDHKFPWQMIPKKSSWNDADDKDENRSSFADTIPDSPSDLIPYDHHFTTDPARGGRGMNKTHYRDFYLLRYEYPAEEDDVDQSAADNLIPVPSTSTGHRREHTYDASKAWDMLYHIVSVLKEEGNKRLKENLAHSPLLAAQYYDKALKYCAAGFMEYPQTTLDFVSSHQKLLAKSSGRILRWSALLKTFISIRLNLSMTLLKEPLNDSIDAREQAELSLEELKPFCKSKGVVLTGRKLKKIREGEPEQTFIDAKKFQAKAYFRLGCAQIQLGDYSEAVQSFQECLAATRELHPDEKPDNAVMRQILEATRLMRNQKKRRRKSSEGDKIINPLKI